VADISLSELVVDTIKRVIFPEEWLDIDLALSKHELFILMMVDRQGETTMRQVAEYVHVSMSTATGIIDRLVKNSYCTRKRSDTDRRVVIVTLTDKARKVVKELTDVASRYLSLANETLTDTEREFLSKIVTKLINAFNSLNQRAAGSTDDAVRIEKIEIT